MRRLLPFVVALGIAGCTTVKAGHAAHAKLTAAEQEDLRICRKSLVEHQCGDSAKTRGSGEDAAAFMLAGERGTEIVCVNGLVAEYEKAPEKKKWLVRNGCPKDMVETEVAAPPPAPVAPAKPTTPTPVIVE